MFPEAKTAISLTAPALSLSPSPDPPSPLRFVAFQFRQNEVDISSTVVFRQK
jgi:hypothetical protein